MKKPIALAAILLFSLSLVRAQFIAAGPVVGGVTHNSARIQVHFSSSGVYTMEISPDSLFQQLINQPFATGNPSPATQNTWMFEVKTFNRCRAITIALKAVAIRLMCAKELSKHSHHRVRKVI